MASDRRSIQWLHDQLPDWVRDGLVSEESAAALQARYAIPPQRRVALIILSILGSVLIAVGIILLFAYNWDELSRPIRAALAITPMLVCQVLGAYVLWKKPESLEWREGVGAGLSITVAAAIGLIGQTYHLGGDLGDFCFSCSLLILPVIYALQSAMAFALFHAAIMVWLGYINWHGGNVLVYWLLTAASLPFYYWIWRNPARRATLIAMRWCLVFSVTIAIGLSLEHTRSDLWLHIYSAWFSLLLLLPSQSGEKWRQRPFSFVGGAGLAVMALILSYNEAWRDLIRVSLWTFETAGLWACLILGILLYGAAGVMWSRALRERNLFLLAWGSQFILLMLGTAIAAAIGPVSATALANLYVLALAMITIRQGVLEGSMGMINKGLTLFSMLVVLRFFDSDLGFILRGVAFIVMGVTFLVVNLVLARRIKERRDR